VKNNVKEWPESNLLDIARELKRWLFQSSFFPSWGLVSCCWRFCDLWNHVAFCQLTAWAKELRNNLCFSSMTKKLDSERINCPTHYVINCDLQTFSPVLWWSTTNATSTLPRPILGNCPVTWMLSDTRQGIQVTRAGDWYLLEATMDIQVNCINCCKQL
jgi:hypothetical protein